jgi:phage FluMu gp28-like protein
MFDPRTHFLPYQLAWINDESPVAIGEKSRRIGWTYASAFRAVDRRLRLGTDLFYTSADLSAAREFIDYCKMWAAECEQEAEEQGYEEMDDTGTATALVLRFNKNGSKIVAGSSNPKFFRSKGGDADADEFAFHRDQRELYKAMQPASLVWGHQLRLWSTHNGEASFFNQLVKQATQRLSDAATEGEASDPLSPPSSLRRSVASSLAVPHRSVAPSLHSVTLLDAVAQGLVEKIKRLDAPNETARRDFLEEIRATCPDEDAWNEEYLCRPSSEQRALLSYALIQSCETNEIAECGFRIADFNAPETPETPLPIRNPQSEIRNFVVRNPHSAIRNPSPLYAGFDVGRKHDRSVLWVVERLGDVLHTRAVRVLDNVNFTAQEQLLTTFLQNPAVRRLCIDSTGIGAMLAERLAMRFRHRVEPVHFTAAVKSDLAMPLLRLFQDKLIRIPSSPEIREDLHKVRKIVTTSNNVRLEADRDAGGHADRFWALALACHAALDTPRPLPASLPRKPIGW